MMSSSWTSPTEALGFSLGPRTSSQSRFSAWACLVCGCALNSSKAASRLTPDQRVVVSQQRSRWRNERLSPAMLRILLADDHEIVRRGLKELLEEQAGWTVCAEAANGREAVELAVQSRPHVAILDFSMPELNGLEATRRIRQAVPNT